MRQYALNTGSPAASQPNGTRRRAPVRPTRDSRPRSSHITRAEVFIERAGVLAPLEQRLDATTGRPRFLSVKALLVAMMVNGLEVNHSAHITGITAVLEAMSRQRLRELGCRVDRWPTDLYKRVDDLFNRLIHALEAGFDAEVDGQAVRVDHVWFSNRIGASPVTDEIITTSSVAIDGTAIETPARLLSGEDEVVHDGDSAGSQPVDEQGRAPAGERRPTAQVLGYGIHDRRKVYTADPDARGGYRTATNCRKGGTYVGYELHPFVMARDVAWSNGADKTVLSDPVPSVILNHALVPAGSHRADAVVPILTDPSLRRAPVDDVIVDPGYTILDPDRFFAPLHAAGVHVTWQTTSHHQAARPFNDNAFIYNGHLVSETLPAKLRDLPLPPVGADEATRRRYQQPWNEVARYRYTPHGKTTPTGVTRLRDPIDAGRLRSRDVERSMRNSRAAPLVELPEPGTYQATVRINELTPQASTADDKKRREVCRWSKYLTGTTAHETAYYARRNVTESAHSALRGDFVDLDTRFFRVFGLVRINTLLGFTIAGYNRRRLRAFAAANDQPDPNGDDAIATERPHPDGPHDGPDDTSPSGGSDPPG